MPGPLLYKPAPKWQIWAAIGGAIAIHAVAAVIAGIHPKEEVADLSQIPEAVAEVSIEQAQPEPEPTPPPEEPEPVEAPPEPISPPEFQEEAPTPPPKRSEKPKPAAPIARPRPVGLPGPMSMSSAKAVAVSAPRPEYPYEARRMHATGSGVCVMTVDTSSGSVTSADMAVSTGSSVLDNAAVSAFRRWRFKPGTVSKVRTPITFTMTGAQYELGEDQSMRMRSPIPKKHARIEIIPLIDIMFFLLASFMMVSLSQTHMKGIRVNLPSPTSKPQSNQKDYVSIRVTQGGLIYFDNAPVMDGEVLPRLFAMHKANPGLKVSISAEQMALHGDVIGVLDKVRSAGIDKIGYQIKAASATGAPGTIPPP